MLSETEFMDRIRELKRPIPSKRGDAFYNHFVLEGGVLKFVRINTG